jgi:hypothetical protein
MFSILLSAVQTPHEAFMNWMLRFPLVAGVPIGLIVIAVLAIVVVAICRQRSAN